MCASGRRALIRFARVPRAGEYLYRLEGAAEMIIVVMGVSGCGKTTIGQQLAERLGWPFCDGDDFHPPANIEKMSAAFR
jgi:MoxR-like ATPase